VAGRRISPTLKRKTATYKNRASRKKKRVSETEYELVVRIPLVVGFRPIVVQPQPVVVAFQVEHVRVAVGVGFVRRAAQVTADLGADGLPEIVPYFIRDRESRSAPHQVFSFLWTAMRTLSTKPWPDGLSIRMSRKGLEKP
jgi:hypothetical protein